MTRLCWLFVLSFLLIHLPVKSEAGLIAWWRGRSVEKRFALDTGSNYTARARLNISALQQKASIEQKTAIQIGKISGTITHTAEDIRWFGRVGIEVRATYTATYGLPYDLIEKGIRVEKDNTTTGLIVIVSAPILLSDPAVDTRSVYISRREKNGARTWGKVTELQIEAERWLTERAKIDAQQRCRGQDALEMTRAVVGDIVLDMVGDIYSAKLKRALAPRTKVVFEHELNNEINRRTHTFTSFEIDTKKKTR